MIWLVHLLHGAIFCYVIKTVTYFFTLRTVDIKLGHELQGQIVDAALFEIVEDN